MKIKRVLFICKHNRFRSKVSEALFNKYNMDSSIIAFSRGERLDKDRMFVAENVKKVLRVFGVKKVDNLPRKLGKRDIRNADLIIVAADNVRLSRALVGKKKVLYWKIPDVLSNNFPGIFWRVFWISLLERRLIRNLRKNKKA